jgi:hypothetical protein
MSNKTLYKGYTIEKDPEPWVAKYMAPFRIYYGEVLSDQRIHYADSIPQAEGIIDSELLFEDPAREFERLESEIEKMNDQLKLSRQCIEGCREEFQHLSNKQQELAKALPPGMHSGASMAVFNHMITLCQTALEHTKG